MNLVLILDIYLVHILVLSPSVGVVGLVEYFCTHPGYLCCFSGRPGLRCRGRPVGGRFYTQHCLWCWPLQKLPLACRCSDDLDPDLDPVWIVLWSITVVILLIVIVFLHCAPSYEL
jgi:hypothetical protein